MVLVAGLEPARYLYRGILSPLRLPIPPHEHKYKTLRRFLAQSFFWRRHPDLNRGIKVLQTLALPLGYGAIISFVKKLVIKKMERETRFELATFALARRRSTTEPFPHHKVQ